MSTNNVLSFKSPKYIPLGFPAGWLLKAFSMACFFWTSVSEKPLKQKTFSVRKKCSVSYTLIIPETYFHTLFNYTIPDQITPKVLQNNNTKTNGCHLLQQTIKNREDKKPY